MKTTIVKYFIYKFYLAEQWFNHQNCEVGYQKAAVSTLLYCRMSLDDWLCQPISWSLGHWVVYTVPAQSWYTLYCTCPVMAPLSRCVIKQLNDRRKNTIII